MPSGTTIARPTLTTLRLRQNFLFFASLLTCLVIAVWGIAAPLHLAGWAESFTGQVFAAVDWFFMLTVSGMLLVCCALAVGPWGTLRLGAPDERPEFSTASWLAMLFAAGMGVGLVFWGAAEPVHHFGVPPTEVASESQRARQAMVLTSFHWGVHAWAVYAAAALVLAYFGFRRKRPYLPGEPLRLMFVGRWVQPVAYLADLVAIVAIAFGVAGSIGMGVLQLHKGLHVVAGVSLEGALAPTVILLCLFAAYMISASTNLDKGIKWLSSINMVVAMILLSFVLLVGPTAHLLRAFVSTLGEYTASLPGLSLRLYPYQDTNGWMQDWTLTYFIWWIAWAPFVGVFIARISRGRTIREFVLGVMLVPTVFSVLWFAVFGGTAMHEEMSGAGGILKIIQEDVTLALFVLFNRLPWADVLSISAILLVFVFLVTSVDSATFVLGMLSSNGSLDPPAGRKLAWGVSLAALAAALMLSGNISALRAVTIAGAIPFTFVLLLQVVALVRALREERRTASTNSDNR